MLLPHLQHIITITVKEQAIEFFPLIFQKNALFMRKNLLSLFNRCIDLKRFTETKCVCMQYILNNEHILIEGETNELGIRARDHLLDG